MKLSWLFLILLLVFVAVFSVQNAEPITVHFLPWQITMSAALVIQLAALLGGLVGLMAGVWSNRSKRATTDPIHPEPTPLTIERPNAAISSPRLIADSSDLLDVSIPPAASAPRNVQTRP
jgi:uncharacterized integral membrane protein